MSFGRGDLDHVPFLGPVFYTEDFNDPTEQSYAASCAISYGHPETGTVDCGLPTDYYVTHDVDIAAYAAATATANPTADFLAFRITINVGGPGYGKYGCRRDPIDYPEDYDTVDGCAVDDTRDGVSIRTEMQITGDTGGWYDSDGLGTTNTHVYGNATGVGTQQDVGYALSFGEANGAYLINPSPPVPVPDAYGNTYGQVLWPVGTPPASITIVHIAKGAHGPNVHVLVEVSAFRDDRPVDNGSTPSPGLMCVL